MLRGIGRLRAGGASPFTVLFSGGQDGAWWDNQDLSTLFSDAARTTPAVVDGEVLGQTDKSGNGRHRSSTAGNGPILRQRSDGVYYLDYAGSKNFSVGSSTALFKYLHDGTGGSVVAFVEWPSSGGGTYLYSATGTSETGFALFKSSSTQTVTFNAYNGSANAGSVGLSRFSLSSTARMLRFSLSGTSLKSSSDSSVTTNSAATSQALATGNASRSISVSSSFAGHEYGVVILAREITDTEAARLYSYFRRVDYRVPQVDLTLLLGGQSNMSGRGTVVTTAAEEKLEGVYSYTKAEEFRIATIPEHSLDNRPIATSPDEPAVSSPQHGFALRAGKALKNDASQDVLLVPCAIGSTSIAQWDTPATKEDRTTLFGAMKYRYGQAASRGGTPAIVWYGHEGSASLAVEDYTNGGVGSDYQDAFTSLVENLRAEVVDAPLVFVQLASADDLSVATDYAAAAEAQRQLELSLPDARMVVAHDLERNASPDDNHVSRSGMDTLGDRVALAVQDLVLSGLGPEIVVNGAPTADKDWPTKGSGWTISSSGFVRTNVGAASFVRQPYAFEVGATYLVTYTLSGNSGNFQLNFEGGSSVSGTTRSTAGTFTQQMVAVTGNNAISLQGGSSFAGAVKNASIRKIINANGTLVPVNGTGPRIRGATFNGSTVTLECDKAVNESATDYGDLFRVYANGVEQTVSSATRNASDASKIDIVCSASLSAPVTLTYGYRAGPASAARTDIVKDSDGLPLPLFGPFVVTAA